MNRNKEDLLKLVDWRICGLSAHIPDLTNAQLEKIKEYMVDYGEDCAVAQQNFTVDNIKVNWEEAHHSDEWQLNHYIKSLIENTSYIFN